MRKMIAAGLLALWGSGCAMFEQPEPDRGRNPRWPHETVEEEEDWLDRKEEARQKAEDRRRGMPPPTEPEEVVEDVELGVYRQLTEDDISLASDREIIEEMERLLDREDLSEDLRAAEGARLLGFLQDRYPGWSMKIIGAIAAKSVVLGMTPDQARAAWGHPIDINRTVSRWGTREQWVYGSYRYGGRKYIYFQDGVLTSIQD